MKTYGLCPECGHDWQPGTKCQSCGHDGHFWLSIDRVIETIKEKCYGLAKFSSGCIHRVKWCPQFYNETPMQHHPYGFFIWNGGTIFDAYNVFLFEPEMENIQ
jgi:hypothetical protein